MGIIYSPKYSVEPGLSGPFGKGSPLNNALAFAISSNNASAFSVINLVTDEIYPAVNLDVSPKLGKPCISLRKASNSYIVIPAKCMVSGTSTRTVAFWYRGITTTGAGTYNCMFDSQCAYTAYARCLLYEIHTGTNFQLILEIHTFNVNSGVTVCDNTWKHVAMVISPATRTDGGFQIFVNGVYVYGSGGSPIPSYMNTKAGVGYINATFDNPTSGLGNFDIDEYFVWKRCLSLAEIRMLYLKSVELYNPQAPRL